MATFRGAPGVLKIAMEKRGSVMLVNDQIDELKKIYIKVNELFSYFKIVIRKFIPVTSSRYFLD